MMNNNDAIIFEICIYSLSIAWKIHAILSRHAVIRTYNAIIYMFVVCVRAYVCVRMCACVCVRAYVCVRECVCGWEGRGLFFNKIAACLCQCLLAYGFPSECEGFAYQ